MKKLLIVTVLSVISTFALANNPNQDGNVVQEIKNVDLTRFCIYNNALYTEGAEISVGDSVKVCSSRNSSFDNTLIWKDKR